MEDIQSFKQTQQMIKGDYELYHYREPYFKSLDFHSHDFYELYLFLDGSVTYYIEDVAYDLMAGDLMIISPQTMHRPVISNENNVYERIVLWLNSDFLNGLDASGTLTNAFKRRPNEAMLSLSAEKLNFTVSLFTLLNSIPKENPEYRRAALMTALYYLADDLSKPRQGSEENTELIPSVIRYINEHFTEPLSLAGLCERFYITKFYLIRQFKEYTNATIYDYVLSKRISLAKRLISQGASAAVAAEQSGFSDYSSFYKTFKAKTGVSPAKYKKR